MMTGTLTRLAEMAARVKAPTTRLLVADLIILTRFRHLHLRLSRMGLRTRFTTVRRISRPKLNVHVATTVGKRLVLPFCSSTRRNVQVGSTGTLRLRQMAL